MSKPQPLIDARAKDSFWGVIEDCLVEVHKLSRADAHAKTNDLRTRIERPPPGISSEPFYHEEPFDIACDLAGRELKLSRYRKQYDAILKRSNW